MEVETKPIAAPLHPIVPLPEVPFKPYYESGGITIYHADCRQVLPFLPRFDLLLTDPPYPTYMVEEYGYSDNLIQCAIGVDCPAKLVFWTPGAAFPFEWDSCHAWDKAVGTNTQFELIYGIGVKNGHTIKRNYVINSTVAASFTGDVYTGHKSQKPLGLIRWCLSLVPDARTVLDPFMGSGTTLVAAKVEGRVAVGIEMNERYCEIAAKRLSQGTLF